MENLELISEIKSFFKNKNVLVTGHTGFKGSWLCLMLHSFGANVTGYSLDPRNSKDMFNSSRINQLVNDQRGNIQNLADINKLIQKFKPEIVFHLAAQALVIESYKNPVETYQTNVIGTVNILEACRKSDCTKIIINITSDKCYENHNWIWPYRENDQLGGHDPYSSSKACSEIISDAYRRSFFFEIDSHISIATARAGNVIGGGDWSPHRIIPDCISAIQQNKPIQLRNPNAIRPWQHVLEPLWGYILLAYNLSNFAEFSGSWNFGPNFASFLNVKNVVEKIIDSYGYGSYLLNNSEPFHEANILKLDNTKSKTMLNWNPLLNIDETILFTTNWYKCQAMNSDMYTYSLNQIHEYLSKLK